MMQGSVMAMMCLAIGTVSFADPLEASGRRAPNVGMASVERQLAGGCDSADTDHPSTRRDYDCKHLRRAINLDDFAGCLPSPAEVFSRRAYGTETAPTPVYILGVHHSFWIPYRYGVDIDANGDVRVAVYVHFRGDLADTPAERASIRARFDAAERIWQRHSPLPGLKFRFLIAAEPGRAHFSVDYRRGWGRGPYNYAWYTDWDAATVAHELGHMMGLHDEYAEFDQDHMDRHCDYFSLMCSNAQGAEPRPYNYYALLRRVHCAGKDPAPGTSPSWPFLEGDPVTRLPDPGIVFQPGR